MLQQTERASNQCSHHVLGTGKSLSVRRRVATIGDDDGIDAALYLIVTVDLPHDGVELSTSAVLLEELRGLIVEDSQKKGTLDHTEGDGEAEEKPPILGIYKGVLRDVNINWQGEAEKVRDHDAQGDQDLSRGAERAL